MMHELSDTARKGVEFGAYLFAGVAAVTLTQAAVVLTIISTLIAIVLGGIRIHDRIVYGPAGGRQ